VRIADAFPGFRLKLTRWGVAYLVASLILGFAAVNTGNNALMALFGLVLGSYAVAGAWSRQVLGNVRATMAVPTEIFAGRPAVIEVTLHNHSKAFPAYGLVVRDEAGRRLIFNPLLAVEATSRHSVEVVMPERGWHELGPWRLEVLLPLGFFLKSKVLVTDQRMLVYPRILPTASRAVRRGGGRRAPDALESRGREGEVTQLRDFREGDDIRALHWKQTARQQRLVVVERQRATEKPVFFVLDPRLADPSDPHLRDQFETVVSEVATGVVQRLREGVPVGIVIGPIVVHPVRSGRRAPALLRPLAEVEVQPLTAPEPAKINTERSTVYSVRMPAGR
jgi:uncharacterized protein (DUF58 family)